MLGKVKSDYGFKMVPHLILNTHEYFLKDKQILNTWAHCLENQLEKLKENKKLRMPKIIPPIFHKFCS